MAYTLALSYAWTIASSILGGIALLIGSWIVAGRAYRDIDATSEHGQVVRKKLLKRTVILSLCFVLALGFGTYHLASSYEKADDQLEVPSDTALTTSTPPTTEQTS